MGKVKQISLEAEGISCTGCATDMETVLCNTDGILKAEVSYSTGIINIEYESDEINAGQILDERLSSSIGIPHSRIR